MKRLFWLALLFPVLTVAQVQRCTIEGKVVYSDSLCGQSGKAVNTSANTIDHSGLRKEAARQRDEAELAELTTNTPRECRFKFYRFGDGKGKILSENAKAECIKNIRAQKQGKPVSDEAYAKWKDHFDQTSANRRAAAGRAQASANAAAAASANQNAIRDLGRKLDDPLKCTQDRLALTPTLNCKR